MGGRMKTMKILFTVILLASSPLWAKKEDLLKCLGTEEKKLFVVDKAHGPTYNLNQTMISEIIQIPNVTMLQEDLKQICEDPLRVSWRLLYLSITKGKSIFQVQSDITGMQRSMTEGMINDYIEASREILLNYIAQIQAQAPSATCLEEEIPRLKKFFYEIKYLQEDVDVKDLFKGRDAKIFNNLRHYRKAFERCRARLKKKAKAASTSAAKKD